MFQSWRCHTNRGSVLGGEGEGGEEGERGEGGGGDEGAVGRREKGSGNE